MKKLFGEINLSWKKLIIWAIIAGIYTGIMAMVPATKDTSFRDIAISFEWWILFGIIIIMNSKSNKDSACKCFIFFLISQPIVYLVQVPFNDLGFQLFSYYYYWFIWTVLTLPMGYIGYYMKKDNLIGLLILTPILFLLIHHIYGFMSETITYFPNHLLSLIFCITTMYLYIYAIFSKKKERIIGTILCTVLLLAIIIINCLPSVRENSTYKTNIKCSNDTFYFDDTYQVSFENPQYGKVWIEKITIDSNEEQPEEFYCISTEFKKLGKTKLILEKENERFVFNINIGRNTYRLEEIHEQ